MVNCALCETKEYQVIYDDVIRDGIVGTETEHKHKVVKCEGCGLVRLLENPLTIAYYQSDEYRNAYDETAKADDYIEMHDSEQPPRLNKIGANMFRDKTILDYGCGGGSFLDLVSGLADKTLGIEPFSGYHDSLDDRGHEIFSDSQSAKNKYQGQIDTIVSFGVLEHVEEPKQYLKDAFSLLKTGGKMYLETDNLNDILMKLEITSFDKFFYRTAHLWYFSDETLRAISEEVGFSEIKISFRHNFDISNTMLWLKDNKPTGNGKIDFFDDGFNSVWIQFLETKGMADLVCVEMTK